MESCEADSKTQCTGSGTAYIVIREEKNVNELGNNVPPLVPYDYSDQEDEKEQIEDGTQGSEDEGYYLDSFVDSGDDCSEFQTFYHKPGTKELLNLADQEDEQQQFEGGTQGSEDEGYHLDSFVDSEDDNSEFQTFYHKHGTKELLNLADQEDEQQQFEGGTEGSEDEGYHLDSFVDSEDDNSEFQTFYHKHGTKELLNLADQEDEQQQFEGGSEDEGYHLDSFVDSEDDNSEFQTFYHKPGTIEDYNIWTTNRSCDVSHYIKILKDNGCSEASFCFSYPYIPGFHAKLDWEQANKMKADWRIKYIAPGKDMCLVK